LLSSLQLLPDGSWLSGSADGGVHRWPDDAPHEGEPLRAWIAAQLDRSP